MADNYRITGQKQDIIINPSGTGFQNVWDVSVQVIDGPSRGTHFVLTVPQEDHNADYIKAAAENKIAALDAVAAL